MSSIFGNLNLNQNQASTPSLFGNAATTTSQPQQGNGLFQNLGQNKPAGGGLFGSSPATQQQQTGGLFGSAPASQPQQTGGLFGSTAAAQPQQGSSLFGSTATTQTQQGGGLFGSTAATSQPAASGGLFGSTPASQPQQSGGGLFGSAMPSQPQQQQNSLFGAPLGNAQQSQPQQTNSLFGGALGQNQSQTQNQNQGGNSLFGNTTSSAKPTLSLFNNTQNQQQKPTSLFGSSTAAQPTQQNSLFGSSTTNQAVPQGSSLFGSSMRPGGLTMGQGTNQPQQQTVPGVRIDVSNVRGTTRFNDLHEELQKQIEQIDAFIQQQIAFKEQCDAMMPAHEDNISSIPNDVEYLTGKLDTTELALLNDVSAIDQMKGVVRKDADDAKLSFRAIENLKLPEQFHHAGMWNSGASRTNSRGLPNSSSDSADSPEDIVSYVSSTAAEFQKIIGGYEQNIAEIENHLRTVEASLIQQSQQVMFRRGTDGGARSKEDQVRELAAVLREFEGAIVGVAEKVGKVREDASAVVETSKGGIGAWYRR